MPPPPFPPVTRTSTVGNLMLTVDPPATRLRQANFGVGGFGYPALVAYNPSKGKFSVMRSAFEPAHVKEFLERLRRGYESAAPLVGTLAEVASTEPWDGEDAAEEAADEFSLDDIMAEE